MMSLSLLLVCGVVVVVLGQQQEGTFDRTTTSIGSFGRLELLNGGSINAALNDRWICENSNHVDMCLYLELYNINNNCNIEEISIELTGANQGGELDLYTIFSFNNEYFIIFNDWNGNGITGPISNAGLLTSGNNLLQTNDIFTLLDSNGNSDTISNVFETLNGNSIENVEILSNLSVAFGASPIKITLKNDIINNKIDVNFYYDIGFESLNKDFTISGDVFDTNLFFNENYKIIFMPSDTTSFFNQFHVTRQCLSDTNNNNNLIVVNRENVNGYWYAMNLLNLEKDVNDIAVYLWDNNNQFKIGQGNYWGNEYVYQFTGIQNWQLPFTIEIIDTTNGNIVFKENAITNFDAFAQFDLENNF